MGRRVGLLLAILECFGLTINRDKSCLVPRARFEHLGLGVDLHKREFTAPPEKVRKLRGAALALA